MSRNNIDTSDFHFFGCYPCNALVTNASELALVIETSLHTPGNNHDNDAKTAQLV